MSIPGRASENFLGGFVIANAIVVVSISGVAPGQVLEFARANLAHFKAPHSVTFVKELPKTATGKIQKYILRAQRPAISPQ